MPCLALPTLTLPPPPPHPSLQHEGVRGLYAGILPEYYKVVPGVAIAFCTYEVRSRLGGVVAAAWLRGAWLWERPASTQAQP